MPHSATDGEVNAQYLRDMAESRLSGQAELRQMLLIAADEIDRLRSPVSEIAKPAHLTWIRFDSDCIVNGVEVKAGTSWGPFEKSKETRNRHEICETDGCELLIPRASRSARLESAINAAPQDVAGVKARCDIDAQHPAVAAPLSQSDKQQGLRELIGRMHEAVMDTEATGRPDGSLYDTWIELRNNIETSPSSVAKHEEESVEWLRKFLNCAAFTPPASEIQKAQNVVTDLLSALGTSRSCTRERDERVQELEARLSARGESDEYWGFVFPDGSVWTDNIFGTKEQAERFAKTPDGAFVEGGELRQILITPAYVPPSP